ncbi:MAG: ammonium transporter [Xanthobacteraceae bacterium]|nr:ammonium transporter [Xanthobacteraceae bacterium]MBX3524105.1 ammonium transporter [Xanthobacteraceae bacterium]MBX3534851.1 ammonium transporter [Xanthobacteraceae bacterium]MBX3549503.1 ammonium transporter [Xanthobacteraceae bacterium]MCW5673201.1 ammonium transporter [Xanthobacteraceae bacterium]
MTFKNILGAVLAALALTVFAVDPALAQDATINKGDTTWMMTATVLVLVMTVPGLALFYGGLVRSKNMLSILMQVGYTVCIVFLIWVIYGYSVTFTGGSDFFGGFSKAFLSGVTFESKGGTFSDRVAIPELVFVMFQATFAAITASLLLGSVAERMKFSAVALFIPLWITIVYFPIAHMVWYWAGPDAVVDAAKAVAAAAAGEAKTKAQAALEAVQADGGYLFKLGALDFAGGTVVHINSGIAGLMGALIVGKRLGYGKELMPPHSLVMTYIGAMLLWFGWFGFNAGSNLEATGSAVVAFVNTFIATAAAGISWMLVEWLVKGKPSLLGLASGIVAGLVAITPASGFAGTMGGLVLGLVAGVVCFFFCTTVKNIFKYDDALDVFGVHCIGGIVGAIGTGIVAAPSLGGVGITDYTGPILKVDSPAYDIAGQVLIQAQAVGITILWSGILSAVLFFIVKMVVGLRPSPDQEREGLDISDHGERAYN